MKPVGKLSRHLTRRAAWNRSAYEIQLVSAWPDIVGIQVAKWARPGRLWLNQNQENGQASLELRVQTAFVLEIQQSSMLIKQNLNRHFGFDLIDSLRIKQTREPFPPLMASRKFEADVLVEPSDLSHLPGRPPEDPELALRLARLATLIKQKSTS